MNETFKTIVGKIKNPKIPIILGIAGIILIFLSSVFPSNKQSEVQTEKKSCVSVEEYREMVEEDVKNIVKGITGDQNPTVVVTLESGMRYTYADNTKQDSSNSSGTSSNQQSESLTKSFITVKSSDGGEKPLVVAELMPKIRGVAVICKGGNDEYIAEKIKYAVKSALDVISSRVYISGGTE